MTETPRVRRALNELRSRDIPVELGDLVVRGARDRLQEHETQHDEEARRRKLREELVERLRTGDGFDLDALHEVREHGWSH